MSKVLSYTVATLVHRLLFIGKFLTFQKLVVKLEMDKLKQNVKDNPNDPPVGASYKAHIQITLSTCGLKRFNISYKKSVNIS